MSSSFPNNQSWGNRNNEASNQRNDLGIHGGQQIGRHYLNTWQQQPPPLQQHQQPTSMPQQPVYQHQQTVYGNNNVLQKPPPMNVPQNPYQSDRNSPWNHSLQPPHYAPHQQQQQQMHPVSYSNNPTNQYLYEGYSNVTSSHATYNSGSQVSYQPSNQFGGDAWNWGWDESSNSSPASSFQTNNNNNFQNDSTWNWNVDDGSQDQSQSFNPVSNYFKSGNSQTVNKQEQQVEQSEEFQNVTNPVSMHEYMETPGFYQNEEQPLEKTLEASVEPKTEDDKENASFTKALTVENVAEVNFQSGVITESSFDMKSESAHSYQSGSLSYASETKTERLSPDSDKIPLTTQALREFHKEIYENGPVDLKSRHNAEGLTPQWSIESQMSQDTASDDISPSLQGGSQSDLDTRPSTVSQSPSLNQQGDQSWYEYPESAVESKIEENLSNLRNPVAKSYPVETVDQGSVDVKTPRPNQFVSVRSDLYDEVSSNLGSLSIGNQSSSVEDVENKEIISPEQKSDKTSKPKTNPPLPPLPSARPGEGAPNPYSASGSLNRRFMNQKIDGALNSNVYQTPVENVVVKEGYVQKTENRPDDSLNQQVITATDQTNCRNDVWFNKKSGLGDESVNLETIPDNKERPDAIEHRNADGGRFIPNVGSVRLPGRTPQPYNSPDNFEVAPRCGPDRNQYLETGRLEDQTESEVTISDVEICGESLPPPGLSRLVTGERHQDGSSNNNPENNANDVSTPPPGLDRMVLGQITENETSTVPDVISHHHHQHLHKNTPPPGLHRMVLGQLTDEPSQNSADDNQTLSNSNATRDDIPPPGFHRMIPGESSSPETQNVIQLSIDTLPREQRVVTGVARDEIDVNVLQNISSTSPTPANRLSSQPTSPEENRIQFQSERCETIGSDNVDTYTVSTVDNNSSKQSKRKDNKDRERHREDISSDERERESSRRRDRDSDYYRERDRNREREDASPVDRQRYRDDRDRRSKNRDRIDWDRDRRKDSPGRYKEDKDRRRDYRDDRRRHRDYDYSDDEDADASGYYSDRDRRNMSGYRDDYDRTYSRRDDRTRSLRPEKTSRDRNDDRSDRKDRRRGYGDRDRERDRDRDPRQTDYYRRRPDDIDDYRDSQRSRPSSRNGSMQDFKNRSRQDYEPDRDRDHYRGHSKRERDMYYPQGYNYDPAYYNYCYQYYENMRRTNPAAYAEWCRKYYAQSQHGTFDGTYTEDRGSVHSGRSSANEENQERRLDSSLQIEDSSASIHRLTPAKFTTAHVKGTLTDRGQIVKILAHYPLDGQPATIEIHEQLSFFDDVRKELQDFPGPLVKGVTHKNNVLRYCKQKIKEADSNTNLYDKESYKLIWELLILLIRQNGTVVGTDIAELLMTNRSASASIHQPSPSPATSHHSINDVSNQSSLSEEEVTNQFRDYLIYGNTKEALEWAMKHGLWGHALFLASKMDQRTYASVMTRFANGLTMNDPLQTLYQLMSGRQPASVTCCADEKWGDWRPHLAMILSNTTGRPDLDVKAITTLGDSLGSRGSLHAAHFCYLMARIEFGTYAHKSSKIVLIGSSHNQPFNQFSCNEAIFATEIFEFACNLADPDFVLHHLQIYKLLVAKRLAEVGLLQEAVHYVEVIASTVAKYPSQYPPFFIQEVYDLGNMLKYYDPVYNNSEAVEGSISDPQWLLHLLNILNDYQLGILQHDGYGSASNLTTYSENENIQNLPLDSNIEDSSNDTQMWQQQRYYEPPMQQQQQQSQPPITLQQQQSWQSNDQGANGLSSVKMMTSEEQAQSQPLSSDNTNRSYWGNQNQWMPPQPQIPDLNGLQTSSGGEYNSGTTPEAADSNKNKTGYEYYDSSRNEVGKPQITLPGSMTLPNSSKQRTISQSEEDKKPIQQAKPKTVKKEPKTNQSSGSWFGGLWNKLALRPKNQMILPDDKDPSIVWDPDKKRWVNLDADEDESSSNLAPPPKASEMFTSTPSSATPAPPAPSFAANSPLTSHDQPDVSKAPPSGANMYKLSRGKNMRSNYVDVMNPKSAKTSNPSVPTPELFPSFGYSSQAPPTNYFIPAPVEGNENAPTDFLTPSAAPILGTHDNDHPQPQSKATEGNKWNGFGPSHAPVANRAPGRNETLSRSRYVANESDYGSREHGRP